MTSGEWFFRQLIRLYPRSFRTNFEHDLIGTFQTDRERKEFAGLLGAARFWIHTVRDVVITSVTLRREFGAKTHGESRRHQMGLAGIGREFRLSARSLVREPGFTIVALVTLGLGIGATTAVFTIFNRVLLTPLGYESPEMLVRVFEREDDNPNARMVAYGNYVDLDDSGVFEGLAIWAYASHTLTGGDEARRLATREVSADLSNVLGVSPFVGRWISSTEESNGDAVVVLSHEVWQTGFGASPEIVGNVIQLDGEPYTVIGIMPPSFDFPYGAQAWIPLAPITDPIGARRRHRHNMVGRLAPDVTREQVALRLRQVSEQIETDNPELNAGNYFEAVPLLDDEVGGAKAALRMFFAAVGILLLIACVNIASLVLVRSTVRAREFAIRRALGASRPRLVVHLLSESVLLGLGGGAVGLLLAWFGVETVLWLADGSIPRAEGSAIDGSVFLFTFAAAAVTGVVVGLLPLTRFKRQHASENPLSGTRVVSTRGAIRGRQILVTAQLTLALILATGAGLLGRSFLLMTEIETGVQPDGVATLAIRLPSAAYPDPPRVARALSDIVSQVQRVPGVIRAAAVLTPPMNDNGWFNNLTMRDRPATITEQPAIAYNMVTGGYFETLQVPTLSGEVFSDDVDLANNVVVINRAAAERHWPNENPIGKQILGSPEDDVPWSTIVAVVDNIRQAINEPPRPEVFVPPVQNLNRSYRLLVRTAGEPRTFYSQVTTVIRSMNRDIAVDSPNTLNELLGTITTRPRFNAVLMTVFAGLALLLASVGVYGVLAYSVAAKRKEIGIRIALGADRQNVLIRTIGEAGRLAFVAIILGTIVTVVASRLIENMLFGVSANDVPTLVGVAMVVVLVTVLAAVVPARMATSVDPMRALRDE